MYVGVEVNSFVGSDFGRDFIDLHGVLVLDVVSTFRKTVELGTRRSMELPLNIRPTALDCFRFECDLRVG